MDKLRKLSRSMELVGKYHGDFAFDWLEGNRSTLITLNQEQMYRGLDAQGQQLRPKYSEDPYFGSPVEAWAYAKWKDTITPHPDRDWDTPNLFINGEWYYKPLTVFRFAPTEMRFDVRHPMGKRIWAKYPTSLGITPENMTELIDDHIRDEVIKATRRTIFT